MEALAESEAASAARIPTRRVAFELKGVMTSLAVLRLGTYDLAAIERQLRVKISQLPQFFQAVPVVLDFGAMPGGGAGVRLATLVSLLRSCHLIPVGVTNACDDVIRIAVATGLGVLPLRASRSAARVPGGEPGLTVSEGVVRGAPPARADLTPRIELTPPTEALRGGGVRTVVEPAPTPPPPAPAVPVSGLSGQQPPVVVRQPVRGGQVIYAQRADLVVLAPVNPGAEVIADGHVHIYSSLRGKAVAGAQGYADARIFCQRLEAELVAVAGAYLMADDIPVERRGGACQIFLERGECRVVGL
ncbi:MAG: septum site-determining protein MinC [Bacteroidota bacterium]